MTVFTPPPGAPDEAVPVPSRRFDPQETFDVKTDAYLTWQTSFRDWLAGMRGWCATMLAEMTQAIGQVAQARQDCSGFAKTAGESAATASEAAGQAVPAAAAAAASFLQVDKRYLGAKAADPAADNQGTPLQAGAVYYNTGAQKVMTWTGAAWTPGISAVAGVSTFNGQAGAVNVVLPAITDLANADLSTAVAAGFYRFAVPAAGAPTGLSNAQMLVLRGPSNGSTLAQIAVGSDGAAFVRGVSGLPGAPAASAWRRLAAQNEACVVTGGAMDLAQGSRFAVTVNGTATLSFVNVPADSVCVLLEINFVSGSFTLPSGSVWANGTVPVLPTGKRHLIYFERCTVGNAGWYVSALPGFAA